MNCNGCDCNLNGQTGQSFKNKIKKCIKKCKDKYLFSNLG